MKKVSGVNYTIIASMKRIRCQKAQSWNNHVYDDVVRLSINIKCADFELQFRSVLQINWHCYYNVICEQKCPKSKISILEDLTPIFTITFRSYFCFLFYSTSPNPLCFDCFQRVFAYSVIYAFSSCVLLLQCEHIICSRQNVYVQLK